MIDRIGQQLGHYRLLRLLGRGGFADVYLGEHLYLRTSAAIKILNTQLASSDLDHFLNEARTIANLVHPRIVRVLDFGVENNVPFLVMEYAPHGTLRLRYPKGTHLPISEIMPYVSQVAAALEYAHSKKLIHRDIKPENMLLNLDNETLLSDFGLALLTQSSNYQSTQEVVGTAAYMAPEQLQGKPQPASDQYALAIVIYEWLTGNRPFHGSFFEIASQHMLVAPPPLYGTIPGITPDIDKVLMTALNKDPLQRFRTIRAFATALDQAYQGAYSSEATIPLSQRFDLPLLSPANISATQQQSSPSQVAGTSTGESVQPRRRISRRKVLLGVAGLVGVAALGGGTWAALSHGFVSKPPPVQPTPLPPGVIYIYQKHALDVYSAVWSPDGARIASCGADRTVQVWDAMTGANPLVYHGHTDEVNGISWWSQLRLIASASKDTTVQVWEPTTGITRGIYRGHSQNVNAVAWAPTGSLIASAGHDMTARVWDGTTQQTTAICHGHTNTIWDVSWSPDGRYIATASLDGTVKIWEANTGLNVFSYPGHQKGASSVSWSSDGKFIASGGYDGQVHVWNPTNGNLLFTYQGHADVVWTVAWSKNNQRIASASQDKTVQIWDAMAGTNIFIYKHHTARVWTARWSPDGHAIASASSDKTVQVWQAS